MKVTCSKCRKVFSAPDEWAGKRVKCPGCKQPLALSGGDGASSSKDVGFDLGSLGEIEVEGQALVFERKGKPLTLKEAKAAAATQTQPSKSDPTIRTCPQCGLRVRVTDLYSEVMCRHCGGGIPGFEREDDELIGYKAAAGGLPGRVSFYGGFTKAAFYPIPALGNIAAAMGIAFGVIAVPLFALLGLLSASALNSAVKTEPTSLAWVGAFLTAMFGLEGIYFGSIAYYGLVDTVRSTVEGNEQPPALTWNIVKLGSALGGYAALIGFYLVVVFLLLTLSGQGVPSSVNDLAVLGTPISLAVLALVTFGIPMNMIGLSSTEMTDGLNPKKVAISIGRVAGNYTFLFLIVLIYLGIYVGLMYAVMSWAGPAIMEAARKGIGVGYLKVLGGVGAWALVVGLGFYFAYSIGRILGLFARTYKELLEFEL
jgi:hypothetical protein